MYVLNILPAYSSAKIILKIKRVFPESWSQTYCFNETHARCLCVL